MGTFKEKKQRVEFIAVGSELLSPHFLETDSLYLSEKLQELGWRLSFKTVVGDSLEELKEAVRIARQRSWLIFISGGLGPTEDDRTRQAFSLPAAERERLPVGATAGRAKGFFVTVAEGVEVRRWLEAAAPRWVEEIP